MIRYQIIYTLNFFCTYFLMKLASWFRTNPSKRPLLLPFLFTDPHLSTHPRVSQPPMPRSFLVGKLLLCLFFLMIMVLIAKILYPLNYLETLLISPMVYFLTEAMSSIGGLMSYLLKRPITPLHHHPFKSRTLSDFWGHRWNQMVQDWFKDIRGDKKKSLTSKLLITFLVSGFFHEIMISFPYFLYFGEFVFGNMMLYFALQGLGLWIERTWLHGAPACVHRIYLWLVIILPSPLFIRAPFLTFFGID